MKSQTISSDYLNAQKKLHENQGYGVASLLFAPFLAGFIKDQGFKSVSDYGAGKKRLFEGLQKAGLSEIEYYPYDPVFPSYGEPRSADLVCCIDVLEHVEIEFLDNVLSDLEAITTNIGFFSIHLGPAQKLLPDGRNAHLIQKPVDWWLKRLAAKFEVVHFEAHNLAGSGVWVIVKPLIIRSTGETDVKDEKLLHQMSDESSPIVESRDNVFPSWSPLQQASDADVNVINKMLPWGCYTLDSHQRQIGAVAWGGKRADPQPIPDQRIVELNRRFGLKGKSLLEIGCFEGVHTLGLCHFSDNVVAVDSRIENVIKSIVRVGLYGQKAQIGICDVDNPKHLELLDSYDVLHHVGVLYHLTDPARHLHALLPKIKHAVLLDTHYCALHMVNHSQYFDGQEFECYKYAEGGRADVFSGMSSYSLWLRLDDIVGILKKCGFHTIDVWKDEVQRHGPRVTLYASR